MDRRTWVSMVVAALGAARTASAADGPVPGRGEATPDGPDGGATALVVIDVQAFYFEGGKLPLHEPLAATRQARRALDGARRVAWPVVHVQHLPSGVAAPDPSIADTEYRFHPEVAPLPGEKLFGKHHANSFRGTGLEAWLRERGVRRLALAGMQTHMCGEAAARAGADLGFEIAVLHDACATRALQFRDTEVPAPLVHATALAAMAGGYARVLSTEEWLAGLPAPAPAKG